METFKYIAISKSGEKVSGVLKAFNEMDAAQRVKQTNDIIVKLTKIEEKKEGLLNKEIGGNRLNVKAFTMMCSQFSIILSSGVSIARTVHLIANKTTDKPLKKMLTSVAEDVESGRSISASFASRGEKLLPPTFVETLYAGEQSGNLASAFESMYKHFDKQLKMKSKVKSALTYPIFVLMIAIIVVIILMVKVVPTFTKVFEEYGSQLPLPTRILIGVSKFFSHFYIPIFIIGIGMIIYYKFYTNTEKGRLAFGKFQLKLPVLGNISSLNAASQFANNMTVLLSAGLPLNNAISITARIFDNYYIGNEIGKMSGRIEEGISLGRCMKESACLPEILVDMVAVGEETGEMEETLHTIAKYYDSELEIAINAALKKLEPTILVLMAGIAGFIVISIYMAMFGMYSIM